MQPVETPHDREIGFLHRAWQVIDAAAADAQNLRLLGDRQVVFMVNHRFALSNPALVSAPSKKSFSSVSSPISACNDFTSTAGGGAPPKLCLPRRDPVRVDVKMLSQLSECHLALDGGKRHLRLEGRCVVPTRSSALFAAIIAIPLSALCRFAEPALILGMAGYPIRSFGPCGQQHYGVS